jgi:hypothetical protein
LRLKDAGRRGPKKETPRNDRPALAALPIKVNQVGYR